MLQQDRRQPQPQRGGEGLVGDEGFNRLVGRCAGFLAVGRPVRLVAPGEEHSGGGDRRQRRPGRVGRLAEQLPGERANLVGVHVAVAGEVAEGRQQRACVETFEPGSQSIDHRSVPLRWFAFGLFPDAAEPLIEAIAEGVVGGQLDPVVRHRGEREPQRGVVVAVRVVPGTLHQLAEHLFGAAVLAVAAAGGEAVPVGEQVGRHRGVAGGGEAQQDGRQLLLELPDLVAVGIDRAEVEHLLGLRPVGGAADAAEHLRHGEGVRGGVVVQAVEVGQRPGHLGLLQRIHRLDGAAEGLERGERVGDGLLGESGPGEDHAERRGLVTEPGRRGGERSGQRLLVLVADLLPQAGVQGVVAGDEGAEGIAVGEERAAFQLGDQRRCGVLRFHDALLQRVQQFSPALVEVDAPVGAGRGPLEVARLLERGEAQRRRAVEATHPLHQHLHPMDGRVVLVAAGGVVLVEEGDTLRRRSGPERDEALERRGGRGRALGFRDGAGEGERGLGVRVGARVAAEVLLQLREQQRVNGGPLRRGQREPGVDDRQQRTLVAGAAGQATARLRELLGRREEVLRGSLEQREEVFKTLGLGPLTPRAHRLGGRGQPIPRVVARAPACEALVGRHQPGGVAVLVVAVREQHLLREGVDLPRIGEQRGFEVVDQRVQRLTGQFGGEGEPGRAVLGVRGQAQRRPGEAVVGGDAATEDLLGRLLRVVDARPRVAVVEGGAVGPPAVVLLVGEAVPERRHPAGGELVGTVRPLEPERRGFRRRLEYLALLADDVVQVPLQALAELGQFPLGTEREGFGRGLRVLGAELHHGQGGDGLRVGSLFESRAVQGGRPLLFSENLQHGSEIGAAAAPGVLARVGGGDDRGLELAALEQVEQLAAAAVLRARSCCRSARWPRGCGPRRARAGRRPPRGPRRASR